MKDGFLRIEDENMVATMSPYITLDEESKQGFRDTAKTLRKTAKWFEKTSKQKEVNPGQWGMRAEHLAEMGEVQKELCGMMNLMEFEKHQEELNQRN
jgi:hypothetical protein